MEQIKKETDIDKIKQMAKIFLHLDYEECDVLPPEIHIYHPFFESINPYNQKLKRFMDIGNEDDLKIIYEAIEEIIDKSDLLGLYVLINKPYRLTFLKAIANYLSDKDLAEYLADAWVSSENPNQDANCSIAFLTKFFKRCDKQYLMQPQDYEVYKNLPETLTLYRGVAVKHNPKGLSWTQNIQTAQWFAKRFDNNCQKGYILTVTVPKEAVLAYFNTRGEDEIVCNANKYKPRRLMED